MIQITDEGRNELKKDSVVYKEFIIIEGKKIYVKSQLFDDCYYDGNFIGTFIMKRLEIETENDKGFSFKEKEFDFYKSIKVGDGWEDLKIGTFIVTEVNPSDTTEILKLTAYDYGLIFTLDYVTNLDYASNETTLQDVNDEICDNLGLERTTLEINAGFIVDSNQFPNSQYGNVVQAIAQTQGGFAKIDENNRLKYIFTNPTDIIIEDYTELEDKRDSQPITIVTLGMSQITGENVTLRWEEGIEIYGENFLIINDNPFTYTQQKRQDIIQAIFDRVKGFAYSSFVTKNSFLPFTQCGDTAKIRNRAGELIESLILRYNSDYDGMTLEAPSIIRATVAWQNAPSVELRLQRTEIAVNKQTQEILLISQAVDNNSEEVANMRITVDEINTSVGKNFDFLGNATGKEIIRIDDAAPTSIVGIQVDGHTTPYIEIFPSDDLFPSDILYPSGLNESESLNKLIIYVDSKPRYESTEERLRYEFDLIEPLRSVGNIKDNFIIERLFDEDNNAFMKCYVLRKIKRNVFNGLTLLPQSEWFQQPIEYQAIRLFSGTNYLYFEDYINNEIKIYYANNTDINKWFATNVEVNSNIQQTAESINLSVEQKTSNEHLLAQINLTPGKIDLRGTITANDGFIINQDGTMVANGGTFNGNIVLANDSIILSDSGLLTNLMYFSSEQFENYGWLGFEPNLTSTPATWNYTDISVECNIPPNFKIVSAKLRLYHTPILWNAYGYGDFWGYSRNLKVYKTSSQDQNFQFNMSYGSDYTTVLPTAYLTEITNAFGASTYTPSNTSGSSITMKETTDIGSYLNAGNNKILVRTTNTAPSGSDFNAIANVAGQQTGIARATVEIIGYTDFNI